VSKYFNVRGFLDCDYSDLDVIRDVVEQYRSRGTQFHLTEETVALYMDGWLYQKREINWIAHAFFGASMKSGGVELVLDQLERIAELIPELEGAFFVDDDEGGHSGRWEVANGRVSIH
jgi:acyl carrier protein phosphodiesterase